MVSKTKEINYNSYKGLLNRVAYKLDKQCKAYKHADKYTIANKTKTYNEIIKAIRKNGKNYQKDEFIARFIEDVLAKNDYKIMPGYVMGSSEVNKYSRGSYRSMVKTVVEYRKKYNKNPQKIKVTYEKITCKSPYVSHPHFLNQGAGYLGQITPSTCGPHSLRQALKKFGIDVTEATLASVAGTVEGSGTDHEGINTAIAWVAKKFGVKLNVQWVNFSDLGKNNAERFKKFGEIICDKAKAVITHIGYQCSGECSEGTVFGHYEYIDRVNTDTGYVRALNSLGSRDGRGYFGHLQDRKFSLQAHYISQISQKGLCIITKG